MAISSGISTVHSACYLLMLSLLLHEKDANTGVTANSDDHPIGSWANCIFQQLEKESFEKKTCSSTSRSFPIIFCCNSAAVSFWNSKVCFQSSSLFRAGRVPLPIITTTAKSRMVLLLCLSSYSDIVRQEALEIQSLCRPELLYVTNSM